MANPDLTLISEATIGQHTQAAVQQAAVNTDAKISEALVTVDSKYGPIPIGTRSAIALTEPGTYWTNDPSQATLAKGYPVQGAQTIHVEKNQSDSDSFSQISISYSGGIYKRHIFNGVAVEWVAYLNASEINGLINSSKVEVINDAASKYGPIAIQEQSVNSLYTAGTYWTNKPGLATVENGFPASGAQTIYVAKNQSDPDSVVQISVTYTGHVYKRHVYDGVPTSWRSFAFSDEVEAIRTQDRETRPINVGYHGAKGISGQDALPAFNSALAEAMSISGPATIEIPRGTYELYDEFDIYRPNNPRKELVLRGESQWSTKILSRFYGADKSLIKSVGDDQVRSSPTSLKDLQLGAFATTGGTNPVLLNIAGSGESRFDSIRFGSTNNTHARISSLQNVRARDIVSFYGGKSYSYRPTNSATFNLAEDGRLVISGTIFSTKDVGHHVILRGSNMSKHKILTYVDSSTVMVDGVQNSGPKTDVSGIFGPPTASITAGSSFMNTNASVFGPGDIGRVIYIRDAKNGAWGPSLMRARIEEVMPDPVSGRGQVRLDKAASRTVSNVEFAVPVIDFWKTEGVGTLAADSNDIKFELLHIENYAGIGLVSDGSIFFHLNDFKIHGEHDPIDTRASIGAMWLNDFGGIMSGELDGLATGSSRVAMSGSNDLTTIDWLASRHIVNQHLIDVGEHTDPNGIIEVRTLKSYGGEAANGDLYQLINDANSRRKLYYSGLVDMHDDTSEPRFYVGASYFDLDGNLHTPV